MLVDNVTITIKAGNGGNGSVHFRRNAQTARGGPDGGNGGNGGNVYLQGIDDILGLQEFRFRKRLQAEDGVGGSGKNLFGRNGTDLIIRIPLGTLVTDTSTNLETEILNTTDKILFAKGGIGGRGNNEFKSATVQTPRYAEKGTAGEEKELHFELRLIADIGLIGLPNAGKSSLLDVLTNAHPKIGNYPFTTLEPNIGMMGNIPLADIPGLIEGASGGRGLGTEFLRHIQKTKLLLHCIDVTQEDIVATYKTVRNELESYNESLIQKKEIILLTKTDEVDKKRINDTMKLLKKYNTYIVPISIYDDAFIENLIAIIKKEVAYEK